MSRKAGELKAEFLSILEGLSDGITAKELSERLDTSLLQAAVIINRYKNQGILVPISRRDGSKVYDLSERGVAKLRYYKGKGKIKFP